jgi:integrase/recombinase XerD
MQFNQNVADVNLLESSNRLLIASYTTKLRLGDLSQNTITRYTSCLRIFADFLITDPINEYNARRFIATLRERNYSQNSIQIYYFALKPFLAELGIDLKLRFKRRRRVPKYYSVDDVKRILAAIAARSDVWSSLKQRDRLIIFTLAYTGLRRAELLSLKPGDVDLSNKVLRVIGKGDKERVIPISLALLPMLAAWLPTCDRRVFPLSARRINKLVANYALASGCRHFHPHSFRHFFATQLCEHGVNLRVIQELLGHADISTTAIYLDVIPRHLQSAVDTLPTLLE